MEGINFVFWNWTVVVYLFVAGVSAGAFAVSAFAYLMGKQECRDIVRIGAYIAPFPLVIGLLFLIYDLERPYLFWKLLVTIQYHSVMSLGAWLLVIFSALSFVHFYLWLPESVDITRVLGLIPSGWDRLAFFRILRRNHLFQLLSRKSLNRLRGLTGIIGIPIALFVGIYTGLLLGTLVARPFWNNPMLPMLFLVSALKTGTASVCLVSFFLRGFSPLNRENIETGKSMIRWLDLSLIILSLIAITLYIFGLYASPGNGVEAAGLIMGGEFTFLFWGVAVGVGVILPLVLEFYEAIPHVISRRVMREHNPWISVVVTLSVLVGGFFLRYVVVYAGQVAKIAGS
jgi:formate-dependent nitrite reductase membrane component NrfD